MSELAHPDAVHPIISPVHSPTVTFPKYLALRMCLTKWIPDSLDWMFRCQGTRVGDEAFASTGIST